MVVWFQSLIATQAWQARLSTRLAMLSPGTLSIAVPAEAPVTGDAVTAATDAWYLQ